PQRPTLIANHGLGDPGWLPCPEEAVVDAVGGGLPGGGGGVGGDADGGPFGLGVGGGDQDAGDGAGAGAAVEDADLVVDQADVLELGVAGAQGAAEGLVEGGGGADALADGQDPLAVDEQADGGLGEVAAVLLALDQDPVALEGEGRLEGAALAADQQLEGGVGDLEGVAAVLQLLDPVQDPGPEGWVGVQVETQLARLGEHVGAAGELGDQHPGLVADPAGVDVAVGVGPAGDGRGVQAGLGGEGGRAHVRLACVGGEVGQLGDGVGGGGEGGQPVLGKQLQPLLELEAGDDGEQVGVTAALAVA